MAVRHRYLDAVLCAAYVIRCFHCACRFLNFSTTKVQKSIDIRKLFNLKCINIILINVNTYSRSSERKSWGADAPLFIIYIMESFPSSGLMLQCVYSMTYNLPTHQLT